MMSSPLVSVIVPVYNAQEYLRRCLDSVCNQTLKDIEIICIDDCSTDNSLAIIKEYEAKHHNLNVTHFEKNQGEFRTRNTALLLAKGQYIGFVDSDDEVDLDFFEKLYNKAKNSDADIVKGEAIETCYNGTRNYVKQIKEGDKFLFLAYFWTAIYKRSMIVENNLSFSTQYCVGSDILFLNNVVIKAKDVQLVDDVYYHYYRRQDSEDSEVLSDEKINDNIEIFNKIVDNINRNIVDDNMTYYFIFHHFIVCCFYIALRNENKEMRYQCAVAAFTIFGKCRNHSGLETFFSTTVPHLLMLLKNKDVGGVADILIKSKSRMQLITGGLRARITKK